ncbi:unnamed protein product [Urochloa decumbens]|uniref:Uncharacterized protein n=1 Tax=Urochloa decumbens TaxID=240449 RepID=A0ABC9B512_9POAL
MLTRIRLYGVTSKHLPKLGGLPSLKYLDVSEMRYVEYISREFFQHPGANKDFPSLTLLTFGFMLGWSEWSGVGVGELPNLQTLFLTSCSKLRCLPLVPFKSLIALHLTQCDGIRTFPSSPALRELRIEECLGLREFPTLPSLLELYIHDCPNLYSIGLLPSLPAFQLQHCPNSVASAVSSFPKLTILTLSDCSNLRAVGPLLSVATLELKNILKDELIYSLLNYLPSLESLQIYRMAVTCIPFRVSDMKVCPHLQGSVYWTVLISSTAMDFLVSFPSSI